MKIKGVHLIVACALITLLFAAESFAGPAMAWKGSGGWGMGDRYGRMFDPKTVETLSGEVISVDRITPMKGMNYGIHLTLKTEKETLSVHLGPGWYIENQDIKIQPKDRVEVKGSRIMLEGKPALIASELQKGDDLLRLRDPNGFPIWSGWRKR